MTEKVVWQNIGPIGQGAIITAILNGNPQEAGQMLRGWTRKDLTALYWAAQALSALIINEENRRA